MDIDRNSSALSHTKLGLGGRCVGSHWRLARRAGRQSRAQVRVSRARSRRGPGDVIVAENERADATVAWIIGRYRGRPEPGRGCCDASKQPPKIVQRKTMGPASDIEKSSRICAILFCGYAALKGVGRVFGRCRWLRQRRVVVGRWIVEFADGGLDWQDGNQKPATGFVGVKVPWVRYGYGPLGCPIENWLPAAGREHAKSFGRPTTLPRRKTLHGLCNRLV